MSTDLVKATAVNVPATGNPASLPELVERAGGAARFAWEEFFYAEHHNPHTPKDYLRSVGSLAPAAPQPSPTSPVMW